MKLLWSVPIILGSPRFILDAAENPDLPALPPAPIIIHEPPVPAAPTSPQRDAVVPDIAETSTQTQITQPPSAADTPPQTPGPTEIGTSTITPPPLTVEQPEREGMQFQIESTTVRRALFADETAEETTSAAGTSADDSEETEGREPKKQKHD